MEIKMKLSQVTPDQAAFADEVDDDNDNELLSNYNPFNQQPTHTHEGVILKRETWEDMGAPLRVVVIVEVV